jgi:hypothetical protein
VADIDDVLQRLHADEAFRHAVRSDPRSALDGRSLSTDDLARVQEALGPATAGPSVESLFSTGASGAGKAGLIGLLLPAIAAVGLVVGFAGGAAGLVGGASKTELAALTPVAVSDCPGGSPVGTLHRGDQVFVTGKDKSGDHLQIRDLTDVERRVWVSSTAVVASGQVRQVAVAGYEDSCKRDPVGASQPLAGDAPSTAAEDTTVPGPATTTTSSVGTTVTTRPGGTTTSTSSGGTTVTTTPGGTTSSTSVSSTTVTTGPASTTTVADQAGPAIAGTGASPTEIWESYPSAGGRCTTQTTTVVSAGVSDPSGVSTVSMSWSVGKSSGSSPMTLSSGSYRATLGSFAYLTVPDGTVGQIGVTVIATDTRGNTSTASITVPLHSASECIG